MFGFRKLRFHILALLLIAGLPLATPETGHAAEWEPPADVAFVLDNWEKAAVWEAGAKITSWNAPGDRDTSSLLVEFSFIFPDRLVDLKAMTDGLVANLGLEIGETLAVDPLPGVYQRAFMGNEPGKPVHVVNLLAMREFDRQRVLMFAAIPGEYERLGGRDFMLAQFTGGKPLGQVARDFDAAQALLLGVRANTTMAKAAGGEPLTHAQFAVIVDLVEVLAGVKLTVDEIETLRAAAIKDWNNDPDASDFGEAFAFLEQVIAAPPVTQLEIAVEVYTEAYLTETKSGKPTAMLGVLQALNPIVVETKTQVLTRRALDARLRSVATVLQLQGKGPDEIDRALVEAEAAIVEGFSRMEADARNALVAAEARRLRLTAQFSAMTQAGRENQFRQAQVQSAGSNSPLVLARHLEEQALQDERMTQYLESIILVPSLLIDLQNARID